MNNFCWCWFIVGAILLMLWNSSHLFCLFKLLVMQILMSLKNIMATKHSCSLFRKKKGFNLFHLCFPSICQKILTHQWNFIIVEKLWTHVLEFMSISFSSAVGETIVGNFTKLDNLILVRFYILLFSSFILFCTSLVYSSSIIQFRINQGDSWLTRGSIA